MTLTAKIKAWVLDLTNHIANIANPHTVTAAQAGALPVAGGTMADGADIAAGAVTGTKLGTASVQKLGLWGVTPVVQPAGAGQAIVGLTSSAATIAGLAVSDPPTQAEVQAIQAETGKVATDLANLSTLLHSLRTAGVNAGAWKGGA